MARKEHHVVYYEKGGWDVKKDGASKTSVHTDKKTDDVNKGRSISKNQGSELVLHGKDGKIQKSDSRGNDSCSPKDRK